MMFSIFTTNPVLYGYVELLPFNFSYMYSFNCPMLPMCAPFYAPSSVPLRTCVANNTDYLIFHV